MPKNDFEKLINKQNKLNLFFIKCFSPLACWWQRLHEQHCCCEICIIVDSDVTDKSVEINTSSSQNITSGNLKFLYSVYIYTNLSVACLFVRKRCTGNISACFSHPKLSYQLKGLSFTQHSSLVLSEIDKKRSALGESWGIFGEQTHSFSL